MSDLKIIIAPDPVLKQVAREVPQIDNRIQQLAKDMLTTMYKANGVGLAAPQVGISERILVVDPARKEDSPPQPQVFINPIVLQSSEEMSSYEEGCLSLPDFYLDIERPQWIRLKYWDERNQEHEIKADGFLATVLQHEIDHLNGVLLVDYLSALKRTMVLKKFAKAKKAGDL